MSQTKETKYYRKGLGNKEKVAPLLHADYHSGLVEYLRHAGYRYQSGETEIRLAKEFGFCYGVDRAVEYAYECRDRFPDQKIWITGEIIHNPWVNRRLEEMGIQFIPPMGSDPDRLHDVSPNDVVLIPAFGMENEEFARLQEREVVLVDTTCGSVLSVWKSVEKYAREGYTAVIHGKMNHEETRATCSQIRKYAGGHYLVLSDKEQTEWVCQFLEGNLTSEELLRRLDGSFSEGFDPAMHLDRVGLANQTTMLSSESLEIAGMLRKSMIAVHGSESVASHYRSFDTICSATQDRQDAVKELLAQEVDLMIVIGGFNSSNTTHLLEICQPVTRAFHVEDADCLLSPVWIRHKRLGDRGPIVEDGWLREGPLIVGITAGASTPDSEVGAAISRILGFRGIDASAVEELSREGTNAASALQKAKGKAGSLPVLDRP